MDVMKKISLFVANFKIEKIIFKITKSQLTSYVMSSLINDFEKLECDICIDITYTPVLPCEHIEIKFKINED